MTASKLNVLENDSRMTIMIPVMNYLTRRTPSKEP